MSEWIDVKERLPDPDLRVWVVTTPSLCQYAAKRMNVYDGMYWLATYPIKQPGRVCEWRYLKDSDVTHWRPLPEPPKGDA